MVVRTAADLVAAIPYMLGFHPRDSIVAVGTGGPHNTVALRMDLPMPGDREGTEQLTARIAESLSRNGFNKALLRSRGLRGLLEPVATQAR